jgi:hypothetical protein
LPSLKSIWREEKKGYLQWFDKIELAKPSVDPAVRAVDSVARLSSRAIPSAVQFPVMCALEERE